MRMPLRIPQLIDISKYKRTSKLEDKPLQSKKRQTLKLKQLNAPRNTNTNTNEARIALNSDFKAGTATLRAAEDTNRGTTKQESDGTSLSTRRSNLHSIIGQNEPKNTSELIQNSTQMGFFSSQQANRPRRRNEEDSTRTLQQFREHVHQQSLLDHESEQLTNRSKQSKKKEGRAKAQKAPRQRAAR
jgi:hypothetical protein